MEIEFHKYHGHGNDFILLNNMDRSIDLSKEQIVQLCHRRFGIGSDGIILLEPHEEFDFYMNFFNPDASQSFCGNGSRCGVHFAKLQNIINQSAVFEAIDGTHKAKLDNDISSILMKNIEQVEIGEDFIFIDTGSPHYVTFKDDIESLNVFEEGRSIRYNERFKEKGTNVNFVKISDGKVSSRVYERGVENETYSSGTGTTAVALASFIKSPELGNNITIHTKGGPLNVSFHSSHQNKFSNIWLTGAVTPVYVGSLNI